MRLAKKVADRIAKILDAQDRRMESRLFRKGKYK